MRILAIDQGTSSTKAMVVDGEGIVHSVAEVPITVRATADGAVEVSPGELLESALSAGRQAIAFAGADGRGVEAIGLANQGETILAWDRRTGEPLSAGIVWQDRRAVDVCRRLASAGLGDRLAYISGLELDPYFVAPKIAWLRPQVGAEATITTSDTWLLHQLTGAFVTDVSTASRSLLLDLESVSWSEEACSMFNIDPDSLPAIIANTDLAGETTSFSTASAPWPLPIWGTCVDQQAALFAESCWTSGEAKCTYGTGAFLLASTGSRPTRSSNGLVGCVAWQVGGETTWCLDGQVYTAGSAITWLQQLGLIRSAADIDGLVGAAALSGETFVPGLAGLAAPFWKPSAKGAFTGLSLSTGRAELVAAVIEGLTASVAWLVRAAGADLGSPLTKLRVDGGLTRSTTLLQLQADLAQLPIEVYPSPHATALGVAAFAGIGASQADGSPRSAAAPVWTPAMVLEPAISADEAESRLTRWRRAAEATLDL
jgi:glycerol kinase